MTKIPKLLYSKKKVLYQPKFEILSKIKFLCRWGDLNWEPVGYKPSALAIELNSSKAGAGKELNLYRYGVLHNYIFIISHL